MQKLTYILVILFSYTPIYTSTDSKEKAELAKNTQDQIIEQNKLQLPDNLNVKTNDNKIFVLPKALINTFDLIKTALEGDNDAKEVPLPAINSNIYNIIAKILSNPETNILNDQEQIRAQIAQLVNAQNINQVYHAADYLGISKHHLFFKLLAQKYAQLIHEYLENVTTGKKADVDLIAHAQSLVNAKYYLPQIANQYFLRYGDDVDKILGVTSKPNVQDLIDFGFLTADFVKAFPDLENNPDVAVNIEAIPGLVKSYSAHIALLTPLRAAILLNDIKAVKGLLKRGARADLKGQNYLNDVMHAPDNMSMTLAQLLITAGAPINLPDNNNRTPLMNAAIRQKITILEYLLKLGADINQKNSDGRTALDLLMKELHFVRAFGHIDLQKNLERTIRSLKKLGAKTAAEMAKK